MVIITVVVMDKELENYLDKTENNTHTNIDKFENNINTHTYKVGQNIIDHFVAHMLILETKL